MEIPSAFDTCLQVITSPGTMLEFRSKYSSKDVLFAKLTVFEKAMVSKLVARAAIGELLTSEVPPRIQLKRGA